MPSPKWSRSRRPAAAPSNYYINGRYVLQPEIFEILDTQERGAGDEIQLTDAMVRLSQDQEFFAHPFEGRMFDCGSKEGFIQANVAFALARDDMRDLVFEPIEAMIAAQAPPQRSGLTSTLAHGRPRPTAGTTQPVAATHFD